MKRVLILTDQYPPSFAPRMAAVAKYLPLYEWIPTVITGITKNKNTNHHHHIVDDESGDHCAVYRLPLETHNTKWGHYGSFWAELMYELRDRRFEHKVKALGLPKPDVIICFAYRKFPLRTAARLSKLWNVPFVADCRDIVEQYPPGGFLPHKIVVAGRPLNTLMEWMRRRIIKTRNKYLQQATRVSTVSPWHKDVLQEINPQTELIYNGYDPELFVPSHPVTDTFRIVYTGRLVSLEARDPSPLFEALRRPSLSHIIAQGKLYIDWYVDGYSQSLLTPIIKRYGLEDLNHFHTMVPLSALATKLSSASILLQLAAPEQEIGAHSYVTTKIFESMAMQKPILVVRSDEAILAEICRRAGVGTLATTTEQIEQCIIEQYAQWQTNGFTYEEPKDIAFVTSFSRRKQTAAFARMFDEAIKSNSRNLPFVKAQ